MKKCNFLFLRKLVSSVLIVCMLSSGLYGCSENKTAVDRVSENVQSDTNDVANMPSREVISTNWEDYLGDLDTLVYGLVAAKFKLNYDVFDACIRLDDGSDIYGLGYTDYAGVFQTDEGETYFPAGFIGLIGEAPITKEDEGKEIVNLNVDDDCKFVYAYEVDPFYEHCVVWNQYLKYGVSEFGSITYEATEYERGNCEEKLGALYSYDEKRYVFDPGVGVYHKISGESLYGLIDYNELEAEVNRILEEQDINFSRIDIETSFYVAKEAVNSYFLSMQEETFMGYKVDELVKASSELRADECMRLTADGMVIIDSKMPSGDSPSVMTKWIIGMTCGMVVVGSIALDIVCPALVPLSGAIVSPAIDVFLEVIANNKDLKNVNWAKVGVSAISGAIMAWCCPMLAAGTSDKTVKIFDKIVSEKKLELIANLAGNGVLAVSNGLVSGATGAAFSLLDGNDAADAWDAFKTGTILGGALTVGVSALAKVAGTVTNAINKTHPSNWLVKAREHARALINKHQIHFSDELEKILVPKSVHQATEAALMELRKASGGGEAVLSAKIKILPSDSNKNFVLKDDKGNVIKKADLKVTKGNGTLSLSDQCDPKVADAWKEKGITEIKIRNGDPQFEPYAEYVFAPTKEISTNRDVNMVNFRKDLANEWTVNDELIPNLVKEELAKRNIPLDNFSGNDLHTVFSKLKLTLHEGTDGKVYLISRAVHESVPHWGGVALAKALKKMEIASVNFFDLCATPFPSITGTLIGEGVS